MRIKDSVFFLTLGVVLLILGQTVFSASQISYANAMLTTSRFSPDPSPAGIIVGAIIALIGLVMTVVGIARLASNVDRATRTVVRIEEMLLQPMEAAARAERAAARSASRPS